MKKCSIKIYSEDGVVSSQKKHMLAVAGRILLRMRNPQKLFEKSKDPGTKSQEILILPPSDDKM
jgi:hypothetical protein